MRSFAIRSAAFAALSVLPFLGCGCSGPQVRPPSSDGELLVVNFEKNQPLRYKMVSERKTEIDLRGEGAGSGRSKPQTMTERMELVMVYTPIEVDRFGLTTLKVTCESAKVTRSSFSGRQAGADAVESLPQMSFTLSLTPTGQIHDLSDFVRMLREAGVKAFDADGRTAGTVKNPDMLGDFIVLQRQMWDAAASIEYPKDGLRTGHTWKTRQQMPWPSPVYNQPTRITSFTLQDIAADDNGRRTAHLVSAYTLTDELIKDFPRAYEGTFQMRGLFGFLRQYRYESIEGGGTQLFDIDAGVLIKDHQQYTLTVGAEFALPLGDSKPVLHVEQTLSIELLP